MKAIKIHPSINDLFKRRQRLPVFLKSVKCQLYVNPKQYSASSGAEPDYEPSARPGCREMKESSQDFSFIGKKQTLMNSLCPAPSSHCSFSFLLCLFLPKNLPPLFLLQMCYPLPHKQTTVILALVLEGNCGKLHVWHGPHGIVVDHSILNQV